MAGGNRRKVVRTVAGVLCLISGMLMLLATADKENPLNRIELVFCSCILILVSLELSDD